MSSLGTDVLFVLPRPVSTPFSTHLRLVSPRPGSPLASPSTEFRLDEFQHVTLRTVGATEPAPYERPGDEQQLREQAARARAAATNASAGTEAAAQTAGTKMSSKPSG